MTTPLNDEHVQALKNLQMIANDPGVHISTTIIEALGNYDVVVKKLSEETGRAPSAEEIAKELGLTTEQVEAYMRMQDTPSFEENMSS